MTYTICLCIYIVILRGSGWIFNFKNMLNEEVYFDLYQALYQT